MLKGQKMSEEHKNSIRKAQIGRHSTMKGRHYIYIGPKIPDLCWCGKCNEVVWNGRRYINGHNYPTKTPEANKKYSIIFKKLWENEEFREMKSNELKERWADEELRKGIEHPAWNKGRHDVFLGEENPFYGKHHTEESKQKNREKHIGGNNVCWKGGISFDPYCKNFNNPLKEAVRRRDGYICQLCSITQEENGRKLPVHHIHYDKENCYPDLICLCNSCNSKVNHNRDYYEILFMNILNNRELLFWTKKYEGGIK